MPAFEASGMEQARRNFAGTYVAHTDTSSPMNLTFTIGDGGLGLGVRTWTSGERDMLKSLFAATQFSSPDAIPEEPSLRLYPVGLRTDTQMAFRGVFDLDGTVGKFSTDQSVAFSSYCAAWAAVSEPQYGNVGLDDFVFDLDQEGVAKAVTARGLRLTLEKVDKDVRW